MFYGVQISVMFFGEIEISGSFNTLVEWLPSGNLTLLLKMTHRNSEFSSRNGDFPIRHVNGYG